MYIPIKKKKKKGKCEDRKEITLPKQKNHPQKDGLYGTLTHGITDSENCLPDVRKRIRTTFGWYRRLVESQYIER